MSLKVSVGPRYGAKLRRTHAPRKARPYAEYRNCLRLEFDSTCAYCLSTEPEVGPGAAYGGFEVEHFKPKGLRRFRRLRNVYTNLLWTCRACNQAKGDTWPSPAEEAMLYRFVDPSVEPLEAHLMISGEKVVAVNGSFAGEYMIEEINLNSALHVMRRNQRAKMVAKFMLLEATLDALTRSVANDPSVLAQATEVRAQLDAFREANFPDRKPWDLPTTCLCQTPAPTKRRRSR